MRRMEEGWNQGMLSSWKRSHVFFINVRWVFSTLRFALKYLSVPFSPAFSFRRYDHVGSQGRTRTLPFSFLPLACFRSPPMISVRRIHRSESRRRKSSNERPSRVTRSKSGQTSLSVRNDSNIGKEIIIRTRLLFVLDTLFVRFFPAFLFLFFSYISRKVARDARQCSLRNSIYSETRAISSRNR